MSMWVIIWFCLVLLGSNLLVAITYSLGWMPSRGQVGRFLCVQKCTANLVCFVIIFKSGSAVGHMTLLWFIR